ncbi:MAG: ABC transporter ATP-binding protein, partial [Betaproteobacteria bacterium]
MERSLFRFIIQFSKRDQLLVVPLVLASMVVYYLSLDLPKTIINQAIQGVSFPSSDSVKHLFGFDLERIPYLFALSAGWMGERMLRRLRYALFDYILRFPLARFRRVKSAEMATMIKDEVEPLGGFIGEALITPLFLGGQALTAMFFILYQQVWLGLIALGVVAIQAFIIPRLRRRQLELGRERQLTARALAGRIAECIEGAAEIHAHDTSNYERAEISSRLGKIFRIRFELYQRKFMVKFLNNLDIGALVAVIAAYKDLPGPVKELIDWDQQRMDVEIKYTQVIEQFTDEEVAPAELQAPLEAPALPRDGRLRVAALSLLDDAGTRLVDGVSFECSMRDHIAIVGRPASGASELAQMLARLVPPASGTLEMGGLDIGRAPEAVTGRALAYVGVPAYLFPASVRDNIVYSLKHRPVRE